MKRFGRNGVAALSLLVAACGDGDDAATDVGADVADAASADAAADAADAAADAVDAAVDTDVEMGACGPVGERQAWVMSVLRFGREEPLGVSSGFDLDGFESTGADPNGCRKNDFVDVDGRPGIDNQFAKLLPAIEAAGGQALEGLIQNAINEGDILLMLELESADSLENDDCVMSTLSRGAGRPLLDATGFLQGGQTFDHDTEIEPSVGEATITDGVLEFGPVSFVVPAYVFFFEFQIPITQGRVRMHIREDGTAYGVMGGGIALDYLIETASGITGAGGAPDALITLAPGLADLYPDDAGNCQSVSATLEFEAVPAFFYDDAER